MNPTEIPTPRTDSQVYNTALYDPKRTVFKTTTQQVVLADVARELERELIELKLKFGRTMCGFCNWESLSDAPDLSYKLQEHIKVCEKHPMRVVELENHLLREALKIAQAWFDAAHVQGNFRCVGKDVVAIDEIRNLLSVASLTVGYCQ